MHAKISLLTGKTGLQGLDIGDAWQMRYRRTKMDGIDFTYRFKVLNASLYSMPISGLQNSGRSHVNAALRMDAENENEMEL